MLIIRINQCVQHLPHRMSFVCVKMSKQLMFDVLILLIAIPGVARVSERFGSLGAHNQGQTKQYCKHSLYTTYIN